MVELKGSKTEENLQAAFAGESQAHTKYQYFALKAKEVLKTKENMLKFGINFYTMKKFQTPLLT